MNITRILLVAITFLTVYGGANYYIAKRLYQWLNLIFPKINAKIYAGIYIAATITVIFGFGIMPLPPAIGAILRFAGSCWMGTAMYLIMLFFAADMIILLGNITKIIPKPIPKNILFCKGLATVLLTAGIVCYGIYNANQIKIAHYDIQTKYHHLSGEMKIALISDLHLGTAYSEKNLTATVKGINSLKPDIVCLAGDIFNDNFYAISNPKRVMELFKSIESTYGVYASLGNHDGGNTLSEMIRFLEESNVKLLKDEYEVIDNRLILVGRLDPSPIGGFGGLKRKDMADILTDIYSTVNTPYLPIAVMDHNPWNIKQYGPKEVAMIMTGHTHGGQMFPINLITNAIFAAPYGHYQLNSDRPHVITTSGAGTWGPPMRIGTNSEIAFIVLRR